MLAFQLLRQSTRVLCGSLFSIVTPVENFKLSFFNEQTLHFASVDVVQTRFDFHIGGVIKELYDAIAGPAPLALCDFLYPIKTCLNPILP